MDAPTISPQGQSCNALTSQTPQRSVKFHNNKSYFYLFLYRKGSGSSVCTPGALPSTTPKGELLLWFKLNQQPFAYQANVQTTACFAATRHGLLAVTKPTMNSVHQSIPQSDVQPSDS